jgi:hypothetical protein
MDWFPGLKPWAESYSPFGATYAPRTRMPTRPRLKVQIASQPDGHSSRFPNLGPFNPELALYANCGAKKTSLEGANAHRPEAYATLLSVSVERCTPGAVLSKSGELRPENAIFAECLH